MFSQNIKILVVEDQGVMRKLLKRHLADLGFRNIVEADDGATAWPKYIEAIADDDPFGLIVSDWNMPLMSGIQLLVKVRKYDRCSDTPFILVTAETDKGSVFSAAQWKVDAYIAKPFTEETIATKLAEVCNNLSNKVA